MQEIDKNEVRKLEAEFLETIGLGVKKLLDAGQALVKLIELDPEARTRLIKDRGIPRNTIVMLERIGNKMLCPELAFADMRLRALPMSEQERVLRGKVDVLVIGAAGADTLKVGLLDAPTEIRNQVLNGDHIRTLDEQRAWLAAKNNQKPTTQIETMPWRLHGRAAIIITKPNTVLTRKDMLSALKAIEG